MDSVDTGPLYDQSYDHTPPLVSQSIPEEDKEKEKGEIGDSVMVIESW